MKRCKNCGHTDCINRDIGDLIKTLQKLEPEDMKSFPDCPDWIPTKKVSK